MTKRFFTPFQFRLSFTLIALFLASCKKDSGGGNNPRFFIKAEVDGTEVQFSGFTNATLTTLPGTSFYLCSIQGEQDLSSPINILGAVITDDSPIAVNKEYSDDNLAGDVKQGIVNYYDNNNNQFSSGFAASPNLKITLTEITDTYVSGVFSGKATSIGNQTVTLTEGSFTVKRN